MYRADEKYVFEGRLKTVRDGILTRLKPQSIREGTFTGMPDDGKTPFIDVFEKYPDDPYIINLARGIVESWMVSKPEIFEGDYFIGFPRPCRGCYEHFHWGIIFEEDAKRDERFEKLHSRMEPLNHDYKDRRGYELMGKEAYEYATDNGLWWTGGYQGHTVPKYEKLLKLGVDGILAEINHFDSVTPVGNARKKNFYEACRIIMTGFSRWIEMNADYAEHEAEGADDERRAQLEKIVEVCRKVAHHVPEDLYEAGQLMWFYCLWDWVDCIGRFDQYMLPFYRGHVDDDLIVALEMKFWEHGVHNIALSGVKPCDGSDATNEITYIMLQTIRSLHDTHPRMTVRINENTPPELLDLVVTMWSEGMSDPAVASDKNIIEGLTRIGVPLERARDYTLLGCQEVEIPGESNFGCEDGSFNMAKVLEYTLNHGRDRRRPELQIGLDLGGTTDYKTFDQLWDAFRREIEYFTRIFVDLCNKGQEIRNANVSKLVKSCLTDSCIERGLNLDDSGSIYNYGVVETAGNSAVADALYAMKTLVYEQGKITLEELEEAIASNFEGHEDIRRMLLGAPKFGNNDDGADEMACRVLDMFWNEIAKYNSCRGQVFTGACSLLEGGIGYGLQTWALPDGRHSGEPLGNTIGPRTGSDKNGLTAMLSSVAKLPLEKGVGGSTCNVLIPCSMTKTPEQRANICALIKTFMMMGGQLAQITTASLEDMKDAQIHPEDHDDLIVRVGGFSMKFIEFDKNTQDEFIMRYGA